MSKFSDIFLSWQIILISFSTFIILGTVKRLGTKVDKDDKKKVVGGFAHHPIWKSLQPILPYPISVGICFMPGVPLPGPATTSLATQIMFGLVAGWLADKVFQIIKKILMNAGVKFPKKD